MYKISIIMPVSNMGKYLKRSLDSLVNQTLKEIEVIIVNNASIDNSEEIAKEYCKKYPNKFKYYYLDKKGVGIARNFGLKKASSKYIGFLDADDSVKPDMFKLMLDNVENNKSDIVVCDYYGVTNDNKKIYKSNGEHYMFPTTLKDTPKLLNIIDVCCWNKIYKKSLFTKDYMFREDLKYEDFLLIPRILYKAKKITKIDKPLYNYHYNSQGETAVINNRLFDILIAVKDLIKYFINNNISKDLYNELEYMMIKRLLMNNEKSLYLENKKETNKFLKQSFGILNKYFKNWRVNYYFKEKNKGFRNKIHNLIIKIYPLLWYKIHYMFIRRTN